MTPSHPLDPLTADEIRRTAACVRRQPGVDDGWRFASIALEEPPKAALHGWTPGTPIARRSLAVVWNRADGQAYEALIDLDGDAVEVWTHRPGVQPNFTPDEYHECDEAVRRHPDVIAALARRGITDLGSVLVDVWAYGDELAPAAYRHLRV